MGDDDFVKIRKSELEELIEEKVQEAKLKENKNYSEIDSEKNISRRSFLRKIGAGALGIGALSLAPVSGQLKLTKNGISSTSGFDFLESGTKYFNISNGGPVEVKKTNLSIDTGNSIQDGNGNIRLSAYNTNTVVSDQQGISGLVLSDSEYRVNARSGRPIKFEDQEGSFTALKYTTSSSPPGNLELTNATLDAGTVNAENISGDYHYSGSYSGSSSQERLTNAISAASSGDIIYLENADYDNTRTIDKTLAVIGMPGTVLEGADWTFNSRAVIKNLRTSSSGTTGDTFIRLKGSNSYASGLQLDGGGAVGNLYVDGSYSSVVGCNGGGCIRLTSNSSNCIVSACVVGDGNDNDGIKDGGSSNVTSNNISY